MRRLFAVAVAAGVSSLAAAAVIAADLKPLTFEALRSLVTVREPRISPDGRRVVYVRSTGDYKANHNDTALVLVDVASGARRVLTRERIGVHAPRWSPGGDRVAYLASPSRMKPPQLYVLNMSGGDSEKITEVKSGIETFDWRPDGNAFAYLAADDPPKTKAPEGYVPAFSVTDEHVLTREPSRPTHLWTIGADGTGAKQLTTGERSASVFGTELRWLADASALVMTVQPDAVPAHAVKARTFVVDGATGSMRPLRTDSVDDGFALSRDGKRVALSVPRHATPYLHLDVDVRELADGREIQTLAGLDRNPRWFEFAPDNTTLLIASADGVRFALWRYPLGGTPVKVDLGDVDFGPDATIARDGSIAFVGQRRDAANEVYVLPAGGGAAKRLTDENAFLAGYALARRERFDWASDDGMKINGVLTYPAGYAAGKKYPLVLVIHGGPVSTSTWNFAGDVLSQMLATRGYLVLQPNYRGSDNQGDAFLSAIVPHVTSAPARDNLAGVEALKQLGIVDETRIGVSGWSGGGLQTSWLIGHASFWRAAVAGAGVYDWRQQAVLADINEDFASAFLGGATPWTKEGRAAFDAESPLTYADAIRTPLLILSDTGDQRVPIAQSYALYHALRDRGRTVKFVAFPRSGHFPTDPVGRESVFRHWVGWFERWMK